MLAARVARAGRAAPQGPGGTQDRRRAVQLSAERRHGRHGRLSVGVRVAAQHAACAWRTAGYTVEVPDNVDALRDRLLGGNAALFGTDANVAARHAGRRACAARSAGWTRSRRSGGPRPGRQQTDGASLFVLGERFGNVFVGVQPAFGYEGDPMRLLFERGFAPTHAFSAFYRWITRGFRRRRGAAFRHPWRAGVHARQAGRTCPASAGPTG